MATVKPFKAIRPAAAYASRIAALPYDVYNRAEANEVVKENPLSFLAIDRAETSFDAHVDTYADCVYDKAKELLTQRIADGYFIQDEKPCYYIYRLTMDGRSQTGLVGLASIDDYENQIIKKHENTRADKEQDRIRHVDTCNAQTGPIFLAYRAQEAVRKLTERITKETPLYDFVSEDGIVHQVWMIAEEADVQTLQDTFAAMKEIYIADGHHRCASAVKVGLKRRSLKPDYDGSEEFNYFLSVFFPDDELMIMDYNRVVDNLGGLSEEAFLQKMSEIFIVTPLEKQKKPVFKGQITMFLADKWYLLEVPESYYTGDPVRDLDVSVLQEHVLEPVLHITDPKTDKHIDFVGGIRGLDELERRVHTDMKVAFAMYPTDISELFAVADAGLLMPPKSTWFEPKLRSGLFIHSLQEA